MKNLTFIATVVLLITSAGCGAFKTKPEPPASELADKTAVASFAPVTVFLNNEAQGSTADLAKLRNIIREIADARTANGVFKYGSTDIVNDVYLLVGGQVPAGIFADVALAINENGGKTHIPLPGAMAKAPESVAIKPNPLTLIAAVAARVDDDDIMLWRVDPDDRRFSIVPSFEISSERISILLARVDSGSIEIAADGKYYLNEPAELGLAEDADDVKIVQRTVTLPETKTGGLRLMSSAASRGELTLLVSESAPTDSLLRLFAQFDGTDIQWRVVIRKPVKEKP